MTQHDKIDEDLERRLRAEYSELAQLAGSLAHEIKNPLSVIRMNMDLLSEDLQDAGVQPRALNRVDVVHRQCGRLENLLNDFLRFARLRNLQLKPGDLNQQIAAVLDLYEPQAEGTGVEVSRYLEDGLPGVLLEGETLQAALVNLVKNALEAMPAGGQLIARTRMIRNGVALDLIDTGEGIPDKAARNMFDAFYSTKQGGSGLGLPTARKIIEAHGGVISVKSETGVGTQFTLEFPIAPRIG